MALPFSANLEMPILHELKILGGSDDVRFLYSRLISYFPSLSDAEISQIKYGDSKRWRGLVQRAGKHLDENNFIRRTRGFWTLTEKGSQMVDEESDGIIQQSTEIEILDHGQMQNMLGEIGKILGYTVALEFEYYDVIWRENFQRQRISHVFEVQSKGNIDSAFAKLKRAYETARSKPFLILASERDQRRAEKSLNLEFSELKNILVIASFSEIRRVYENLTSIKELLPHLLND